MDYYVKTTNGRGYVRSDKGVKFTFTKNRLFAMIVSSVKNKDVYKTALAYPKDFLLVPTYVCENQLMLF